MFLQQGSFLKTKKKSFLHTELLLTPLLDAFTVILIYLIVFASAETPYEVTGGIQLAKATQVETVDGADRVVVKNGSIMYKNKVVDLATLKKNLSALSKESKDKGLVIEADRTTSYENLKPILRVASELEMTKTKLSVEALEVQ